MLYMRLLLNVSSRVRRRVGHHVTSDFADRCSLSSWTDTTLLYHQRKKKARLFSNLLHGNGSHEPLSETSLPRPSPIPPPSLPRPSSHHVLADPCLFRRCSSVLFILSSFYQKSVRNEFTTHPRAGWTSPTTWCDLMCETGDGSGGNGENLPPGGEFGFQLCSQTLLLWNSPNVSNRFWRETTRGSYRKPDNWMCRWGCDAPCRRQTQTVCLLDKLFGCRDSLFRGKLQVGRSQNDDNTHVLSHARCHRRPNNVWQQTNTFNTFKWQQTDCEFINRMNN